MIIGGSHCGAALTCWKRRCAVVAPNKLKHPQFILGTQVRFTLDESCAVSVSAFHGDVSLRQRILLCEDATCVYPAKTRGPGPQSSSKGDPGSGYGVGFNPFGRGKRQNCPADRGSFFPGSAESVISLRCSDRRLGRTAGVWSDSQETDPFTHGLWSRGSSVRRRAVSARLDQWPH